MEKKKKVLIVDDDDNLRLVLMDKLQAAGFDVADSANGAEGVEKAFKWHPDVILLDVMMPKMDGWQTLELLRANEWGKNVRVIMLTVVEDVNAVARAMGKGVREYILKTDLKLEEVIKTISQP